MAADLRARVTAGTAIFRGDRILLLRRALDASNPGIWDLPGGHVQFRETLRRAAKRETLEETGYEVRLGPLFHAEVFRSQSKRGKVRENVGVYFHCSGAFRRSPQLDTAEHMDYAWVALSDLKSYATVPFLARTIRAAFDSRGNARGSKGKAGTLSLPETSQFALPVPA